MAEKPAADRFLEARQDDLTEYRATGMRLLP